MYRRRRGMGVAGRFRGRGGACSSEELPATHLGEYEGGRYVVTAAARLPRSAWAVACGGGGGSLKRYHALHSLPLSPRSPRACAW